MMTQGADVIFGCGGRTGDGALVAAAQEKAYVIGVDTDQYWTLPEASSHMLSSVIKLVAAGVLELIQLSYEGKFPDGDYMGHVGYAPFHDLDHEIPPDVKEQMEAIRTGLTDGSIETNVPSQQP
jgi:basic membrane protein A